MALGALVLISVPLLYLVLAFAGQQADVQGILIIVSSTVGMVMVVIGAALRD
jgi:hypothetical protein